MSTKAKKPTKEQFFQATNGRSRTRIFSESDWEKFEKAWAKCLRYARAGKPFFVDDHAGGVANSYGYRADTARWGVWVDPATHAAKYVIGRVQVSGKHVARAYCGGEPSYKKAFREGLVSRESA